MPDLKAITDALTAAQKRGALPTRLGTAELRELGAEVLARSVFTARGTNAIFASKLKEVIDLLAAGDIGEGQARTALYEVLDALGYDVEKGGFPGEELEPGLKGTLQDLRSFRRLDLIVRTQRDLMQGAGAKMRGSEPDRLQQFPAYELVRVMAVEAPRDWPSRWQIAGGTVRPDRRMIALKGAPIWGELGSYQNFSDALGVDHPPFAFNSGMGWRELSAEDVAAAKVTGPDGATVEEFLKSQPVTMTGKQPLPTPKISLVGVDPAIIDRFKRLSEDDGSAKGFDFEASAKRSNASRDAQRAAREAQEKADALASYPKGVPTR
jgi:hypothetical protein